jgi:hypothetical protein
MSASEAMSTTSDTPLKILVSLDEDGGIQVLDDEVLGLIAGGQPLAFSPLALFTSLSLSLNTALNTTGGSFAAAGNSGCLNIVCKSKVAVTTNTAIA